MKKPRDVEALARLLEQTSRSLHGLGFAEDLFPAQWSALRYFTRAEPRHRTASALARFQGMAVGPVTRTVRTLVSKGYLESVATMGRGAAKQLALTETGRALLTRDPLSLVAAAAAELEPAERRTLAAGLEHILRRVQTRHDEVPAGKEEAPSQD